MVSQDFDMKPFSSVPVNLHLGLVLSEQGAGVAVVTMAPGEQWTQETGVIHGGLVATLADTAAVYALRSGLPSGHIMTSIEFKLNFLSPARADKGTLVARARVVRQGRRVGVCDVDVEQAALVVAKGLFTYLFLEGKA
jgi:uncharacterized protein (TIGR00369 family)